ncbi:protein kinase domain-containing protein [Nocardia gipuzkoensis]
MSFFIPGGRRVTLQPNNFGGGAEGLVYGLDGTSDLCAKIYLDQGEPTRARKLAALRRTIPATWEGDNAEHLHVAWPREVLHDAAGATAGFLMPLVQGKSLTTLFDPGQRIEAVDDPTWRVLVAVAARAARLLAMLHAVGIVVGDVSPTNMLVSRSGHVTLIDCDAVQFTDPRSGELFRCTKVTPEYAPPMAANGQTLTPSHDNFGLAVLVCQLLMEGDHPFEGVPVDPDTPDFAAAENIQQQNNRLLFPERFVTVPGAAPVELLPPEVRELAMACFGNGHRDPTARPTAQAWADALDRAGFRLMGCRENERHVYHSSLSECVWCGISRAGLGEHYPAAGIPKVVIPPPTPPIVSPTTQRPPVKIAPTAKPPRPGPRPPATGPATTPKPRPTVPSAPSSGSTALGLAAKVMLFALAVLLVAIAIASYR